MPRKKKAKPDYAVEAVPPCPFCDHQNPHWLKGVTMNQSAPRRKKCERCGKLTKIWFYRVYVIAGI